MKYQLPTHLAELNVPVKEYSKLLGALDEVASLYGLKRLNAGSELNVVQGREALFAAYEPAEKRDWRGAMDVSDHYGPGRVTIRIYGDYFDDPGQRDSFVEAVSSVASGYGGNLSERILD